MFDLQTSSNDQETNSPANSAKEEAPRRHPGTPVDFSRVLRAVRQQLRKILFGSAMVCLVIYGLVWKFVSQEFSASSTLVWEPGSNIPAEDRARVFRTLIDRVKLVNNLQAIREQLRLTLTLEQLGKRIDVSTSEDSHLVTFQAVDRHPEPAAQLVNTAVSVFLNHLAQVERQRLSENVQHSTTDLQQARASLAQARDQWQQFRREYQLSDLPLERQLAIAEAAQFEQASHLSEADARGEDARQQWLQQAAVHEAPTVVLSETLTDVAALRYAESQTELTTLQARLTDDHPRVQASIAQTEALRVRVHSGNRPVRSGRITGRNPQLDLLQQTLASSSAQREHARARSQALAEQATVFTRRIDRLSTVEGIAAEHLATIQLRERHVGELEQQLVAAQDALRSENSGFRLLSAAVPPDRPSKSHKRLIAVAATVLVLLIGVSIATTRAIDGFTVYTPGEAAFWSNSPVIATAPALTQPGALTNLALDLQLVFRQHSADKILLLAADPESVIGIHQLTDVIADRPDCSELAQRFILWSDDRSKVELRRMMRAVGSVVIIATSGRNRGLKLRKFVQAIPRRGGVGIVLINLGPEFAELPDQVGDLDEVFST